MGSKAASSYFILGPTHQFTYASFSCWKRSSFCQVDDLPLPFNALSYLMVARYAVQATVVNELPGLNDKTAPTLWSLLSQQFLQFQSQTKGDLYVKMHPKKTTKSKRHAPLHLSLEIT